VAQSGLLIYLTEDPLFYCGLLRTAVHDCALTVPAVLYCALTVPAVNCCTVTVPAVQTSTIVSIHMSLSHISVDMLPLHITVTDHYLIYSNPITIFNHIPWSILCQPATSYFLSTDWHFKYLVP